MNQDAIKEVKGNGKVEVSRDTIDLIKGLKFMDDLGGCYYLLENLEILSRFIDEIDEGNLFWGEGGEKKIIAIAYWQRKIIDEIRHILDGQDCIIMRLKKVADIPVDTETVEVDYRKLEALRHLTSLFCADGLFYTDKIDLEDLKAWAMTHGYDLETVKALLGKKEVPESIPNKEAQRQAAKKLKELGVGLKEFEKKEGIKLDLPEEEKEAPETDVLGESAQGQE